MKHLLTGTASQPPVPPPPRPTTAPKSLRCPPRAKAPTDPVLIHRSTNAFAPVAIPTQEHDDSVWSQEEFDTISALFERKPAPNPARPPAKPRPLPLPLPHQTRPSPLPTPKHHVRAASRRALSPRSPLSDRVHKNPETLVRIARDIAALPAGAHASAVLDRWAPLLRKGSLSLTVRELGHLGLPDRALQTLCWAQQRRPALFPDDRVLASAVEVLARHGRLKLEAEMEHYLSTASRCVVEAMARGFIRAGQLYRARKLLLLAKDNNRTLDLSIHAKLILEAGKNPDRHKLVLALLDELGQREDFDLEPQDCTAIMKVCIRLGKCEIVDGLLEWFRASGRSPTVVMYTTVIHSRYCSKNYREGMALVWEMEESNCLLDLPAYRVVIRLCVALNDLARAVRYFSRLKEAGFSPTYDIYRDIIKAYAASGRLAKCRQICKEVEMAGLRLDKWTLSLLSDIKSKEMFE